MKTITLIRHAESLSNAGGVTMPHAAIPLSERGRQQAEALAESLSVEPAAVIVSGMVRTHQTAAPYCARFNITPQQHIGLNEFSVIDSDLIAGMYGPQRRLFVRDYWDNPDPHRRWGEKADTFIEFEARVRGFIDELDRMADSTVIFGHGIWLGMLHWLLSGNRIYNADDMHAFRCFQLTLPMPNCAVFHVELRDARAGKAHWEIRSQRLLSDLGSLLC
jgi:broad specificity phosphatase PhoE